ncbi:Plasmodium exported protein, unknown function [Plasmodium knowlesi strain H]|uniref:Plasmodium RESA N-terminal domain-containing protein n=3 Tax=Plasmodium knowlesi TaxID=5850 RepID=A0A5K1VU03_PLAKH|nr:Plasmodium exported protein (PHIST), unknown function [Plasmodium knowlesi strain H]OTN68168.1 Uncharacterized protein PKNOH_S04361000 [Plasmodium knowlesi]CAA9986970.1 Plasmodium exported protein (PHIST), unknown function [Plasmodium knowlesi strain H]SBO26593.1 Plasmodium exported protein, unknown function [Plasmodium knowlesi strain H]SBO28176.1 Plasmodium exported protein, unknown function [Plasmodium knowlesi strain H]VVS76444.1 Plasmodium exported protein (PHIST), unknown function [Pl|eukprot:XP_002258215.1 hypothetical protein, conserved in Plasmodium species [Plasmodium knowlesi strain H]
MRKNANSKSQCPVRYVILLSFIFVITFLSLNPVRLITLCAQSELQLPACPRKLVEVSLYLNEDICRRVKNAKFFNEPYLRRRVLPFGCEEEDISKKISRMNIEKMSYNTGFLFADKKKAYVVFHYLNDYHKDKYHKMINHLWIYFTQLAGKIGMPDEERLKFLMGCHSALTRDLDTLDESYENRFFSMANNKLILQLSFRIFLSKFIWSCDKLTRGNKRKWRKALLNIIETYKA